MRPEVPVALLPAHRRRVERREERGGRLGRRRRLEVAGEHVAGRAAEVDLGVRAPRRVPRASPAAVQPVHQRMSVSVAGPKAASQRRSSSTCAAATSSSSIGPPSQSSVVTQRNWGLIHVPRGRPRTRRPSIAICGSTRAPALCSTTQRPEPKRSFFASSGTSAVTSVRHRLAARGHRGDGGVARARDPGARPRRDAAVADEALEPLPLRRRDRLRRGCEHDRQRARAARPRASAASRACARGSGRRTARARRRPARRRRYAPGSRGRP